MLIAAGATQERYACKTRRCRENHCDGSRLPGQWQEFLKESEKETSPPWYLVMGELAHFLVENYAQGATAEFSDLFASVETLLHKPDPELENLITVGLLEDIQNVASHRDFGAAPFLQWLGPRSLVVWNEINTYMKRVSDWAAKQ